MDAKAISDRSPRLSEILPGLAKWIEEEVKPEQSFGEIADLLCEKLSELIEESAAAIDPRFYKAIQIILEKRGHLDLAQDLQTGLSPRQLRRIFNHYIGTTPKAFCNVVRFQHILNAKPSRQSLKDNKLYFDLGFFDQAHFIKQFKTFYGVTPSEAFR